MAIFGSIIKLSSPIGLAAAGPAADAFGIQVWFIAAGVLIFISMGIGLFNQELRQLDEGPCQKAARRSDDLWFDH
ncbi:MAG: hypothetical protein Q7J07_10915 [Pelolinea sp.]|nr:hypothetical protein [Pelolinea sp.]